MAREGFRTLDAIAWLDPSDARVSTRKSEPRPAVAHNLQGQPQTVRAADERHPPPGGSTDDGNGSELEEGSDEGDSGYRAGLTSWRSGSEGRREHRSCQIP